MNNIKPKPTSQPPEKDGFYTLWFYDGHYQRIYFEKLPLDKTGSWKTPRKDIIGWSELLIPNP